MTTTAVETSAGGDGLRERWLRLRADQPGIRSREAAAQLGASEAELVACRCGNGVRRLDGPWGELIETLPTLGPVMALTRNDFAVHEKTGNYDRISITGRMGLVLNREIDLRLLLGSWASGFAVSEQLADTMRHSLQFFAPDGMAIHKIYIPTNADTADFEALVTRFLHEDQSGDLGVSSAEPPVPDGPDEAVDVEALRADWHRLHDVHDFMAMLKRHRAGRLQAMRLAGEELAWQVDNGAFPEAVERAAESGLSIMIFVGSPGVIQIHTGPVFQTRVMGPWFNVLDPGFNLHLRKDGIARSWVVRKPTRDGIVTSLEIYDADGGQIALMFGERHEGQPENPAWRALTDSLARVSP